MSDNANPMETRKCEVEAMKKWAQNFTRLVTKAMKCKDICLSKKMTKCEIIKLPH